MNLNRLLRYLLLLLFALLQCLAPLAHAHVNGDNTGHAVYIEINDTHWADDHDHASIHHTQGEHHSAVVCMPPEFRCSILLPDQAAAAGSSGLLAPVKQGAVALAGFKQSTFSSSPYQHPLSQAPPFRH